MKQGEVLVPLVPGCEELEAVTIIDILRRGGVNVVTASLEDEPVKASRGVVLKADTTLAEAVAADTFDMVAIPGGMGGATTLADTPDFINYLRRMNDKGRFVAAICAAPMALGKAGLLDNRIFTAYPGVLDATQFPGSTYTGKAIEMDGNVVTSRGPGTAMDFALTLLELVKNMDIRDKVEKELVRS